MEAKVNSATKKTLIKKLSYSSPVLVEYGNLAELTTAQQPEGGGDADLLTYTRPAS